MDYELVRTLLHKTLRPMAQQVKSNPSESAHIAGGMQLVGLTNNVERLAQQEGHISKTASLTHQDKYFVVQAIWELIIQGVLVPSNAVSGQGWPFVSFTDYGEKTILEERPTPYDPTAYLSQFGAGMDDMVRFYVEEALGCLRWSPKFGQVVKSGFCS